MGLVREVEVTAGNVAHLCGVVGRHALGSHDTEVELAVNHTNRGIPLVDKQVRGVRIALLDLRVVPIPVRTADVPVVEPHLFCL